MSTEPKNRRWMTIAIAAMVMNTVLATAVVAGHRFNDVSNTNTFHNDITWLADNDITRGCNPPANTRFCPKDNVTREQMAAFVRRNAQTLGAASNVCCSDLSDFFELSFPFAEVLSVDVAPKAEANVVLNATVELVKTSDGTASLAVQITRGSCDGPQVGVSGVWRTSETTTVAPVNNTVSVTGVDTVSAPTTYKVCANGQGDAANLVGNRAITAVWMPTG